MKCLIINKTPQKNHNYEEEEGKGLQAYQVNEVLNYLFDHLLGNS